MNKLIHLRGHMREIDFGKALVEIRQQAVDLTALSAEMVQITDSINTMVKENSTSNKDEEISAQVQQVVASSQCLSGMAYNLEKAVSVLKTKSHGLIAILS
jgi:hypothetical protein